MARKKKTRERVQIEACAFAYRCPRHWQSLETTFQADIRYCNECERTVHLCRTLAGLSAAQKKGLCVAVPAKLSKTTTKSDDEIGIVGMLDPGYVVDSDDEAGRS